MDRENEDRTTDRYEDLFLAFGRRVEKGLTIALLVLLCFLVLSQLLLQIPRMRYLMVKVEQLEGNPYLSSHVSTAQE